MSRRHTLVRWLRGVRDRLDPVDPIQTAVPDELEPEDVQLDAFALVHKAGIGWDLSFIDLRPAETRVATGMVEGAVSVDAQDLDAVVQSLDPHTIWVFYGPLQASVDAALHLRRHGHGDVWCMRDGFEGWRREGGPTVGTP